MIDFKHEPPCPQGPQVPWQNTTHKHQPFDPKGMEQEGAESTFLADMGRHQTYLSPDSLRPT